MFLGFCRSDSRHLPANGDYDTSDAGRFVDSITFFQVRAADDAYELPAPLYGFTAWCLAGPTLAKPFPPPVRLPTGNSGFDHSSNTVAQRTGNAFASSQTGAASGDFR